MGILVGYGNESEIGYRLWLTQSTKFVSGCCFNEEKLLKNAYSSIENSKSVTFQQSQPSTKSQNKPHDVIPKVKYDDQPVIFEPEEVGQQGDAH